MGVCFVLNTLSFLLLFGGRSNVIFDMKAEKIAEKVRLFEN